MKFLQRLGKSLMLPVAVLPVAAILSGVSYWIAPTPEQSNALSSFLSAAGGALLSNMGLLFAVGVAFGMAVKSDGAAALAGLVSWLSVTTLLSPATVSLIQGIDEAGVDPAFRSIQNVFVGILCGLIGALCYNRFKDVRLPDALSFFSGKRAVAIVTAGASLIFALVLYFVWPLVYGGLVAFGEFMLTLGPVGAGLYGFFNRLLIPTGLHHALNSVFWFDVAGINDLGDFLSGTGEYGVTGQYMTGFFPVLMFGLPGAALAMYLTARSTRRKVVYGLMLSASFASFFVGVSEPIEFAFMFLAPVLFLVHAVFMGLSLLICALLPVRMGFGFSGGFIDLVVNWSNPMAQNPWIILVMGIFWFGIYFVTFYVAIKKFDLKTPGREDESEESQNRDAPSDARGRDHFATAERFVEALGGAENITELDNCTTRLRLEVVDTATIDTTALTQAGASGVLKPGGRAVQVVYGLEVQFIKDAMEQILAEGTAPQPVTQGEPVAPNAAGNSPTTTLLRMRPPLPGRVVALSEVPDEAFADGGMGPGLGIIPTAGTVLAPADCLIAAVFPTGHAIAVELADGTELLIHVGVDTVKMRGDGFETLVSVGDRVTEGTPLLRADLPKIQKAGYSAITSVVVLNDEDARIAFTEPRASSR